MNQLIVPGKLDSLSQIAKYVLAAAAEADQDQKASYGLQQSMKLPQISLFTVMKNLALRETWSCGPNLAIEI
jgi:hypothetical protein